MAKNPRLIDMTGQRFGRWTVISQAGNTPRGGALWLCACDCGERRPVNGADLRFGKSLSCGCLADEMVRSRSLTHGETGTRLHRIWSGMRARCRRPNHPQFADYGGRGVKICSEWDSFEAFRDWALSAGYSDSLSIEREDVNGHYSPQNCIWADAATQNANRRFVSTAPNGELWLHRALRNGITRDAFYVRKRNGWPMEQAVTWPLGKKRPRRPGR